MAVAFDHVRVEFSVEPGEVLQIDFAATGPSAESKAGVMEIRFTDDNGNRIRMEPWSGHSSLYGDYRYVGVKSKALESTPQWIQLTVPAHASKLELHGHSWKGYKGLYLHELPFLSRRKDHKQGIPFGQGHKIGLLADFVDVSFIVPKNVDHVQFEFDLAAGNPQSVNQVVGVEFRDSTGDVLLPAEELFIHERLGGYLKVQAKSTPQKQKTSFIRIPDGSHSVTLKGTSLLARSPMLKSLPVAHWKELEGSASLESFLDQIRKEDKLVIFDTTGPAMGDPSRALRPNNLAWELAKSGTKIIFFPFSSLGQYSFRPHKNIFQTSRDDFLRVLQIVGEKRRGRNTVYVCTSFSDVEAVAAINLAERFSWLKIYEARDDMEEFNREGYSKWYQVPLERWVIQHSDKVGAVSDTLSAKLKTLVPRNSLDVHVSPNAAPQATIEAGSQFRDAFHWNSRPKRVGYVGHFTPSWFDWELVLETASNQPEIEFELIGFGLPKNLDLPMNVLCHGPKSHEEILAFAQNWRAGLIPFRQTPLSLSVDPNKLFEYAAWGLRTVSSPMGSVDKAPSTWVYTDQSTFELAVIEATNSPMSREEMSDLDRFARVNSWANRAKEFAKWVEVN